MNERIIILYHGDCPDGFGGAYAAWKKFGDAAEYVPAYYQKPVPIDPSGATVIFIDFCYPQDIMDDLVRRAASVTVLDHHVGTQAVVESMPIHVYDGEHSGAVIAWRYFHPNIAVPMLLQYVQEGDFYRATLPDTQALLKYAYTKPFEFHAWDELVHRFEDPTERASMIEKGSVYVEYAESIANEIIEHAKLVSFEGYECYFAASLNMFKSDVGNQLAKRQPPLALVVHALSDGLRVSLRGDGSVDVAAIARKYGGNGHHNAAAFTLAWGAPLPWKLVEDDAP